MALTKEEQDKIRALLAKENEQKQKSVLSSLESFARWVEVTARIVVAFNVLKPVFLGLCSLFL